MTSASTLSACQVCSSADHDRLITQDRWTFFRCGGCGFVFMHPMLSAAEIAALYSNPESGLTASYFRKRQSKIRRARIRMRQFARRIEGGPVGRTFLDIGCSGGFTTEAARERGFAAHGIDLDAVAVADAREHYPLNRYFIGGVEEWTPPDGLRFDAVYCSEVLEHVPGADRFIAAIARLLTTGGMLYLTTPDIGHWRRPRDLAAWDVFTPPHHCIFFSEANLRQLLERHGLAVRHRRFAFKPGLKVFAEKLAQ